MGFVDFTSASRICCQFKVSLISKETLPNSKEYEHRMIKASTQENCFGTDMVTFAIQVPSNSIPTFANELGE